MGQRLINALAQVTPVVIDFEYTTPTGAPFEPIEVAVQALCVRDGRLERATRWEALMRPPQHAELTPFDIGQTGITPDMLAQRPCAGEVLAELDRRFSAGPYVLIAHHAPAEAGLIYAYREHCPHLARIDLIDTVRLARNLTPTCPGTAWTTCSGTCRSPPRSTATAQWPTSKSPSSCSAAWSPTPAGSTFGSSESWPATPRGPPNPSSSHSSADPALPAGHADPKGDLIASIDHTSRGRLISIEGLSGVGKTYLTNRVIDATTAVPGQPHLVVEEFSQRRGDGDVDLGRRLVRTLVTAAQGEHFLRAGFPKSETLFLLAIKMHDFETTLPDLLVGRTVIEGRSVHSTAVYQSLIMHPDDYQAAAASVTHILDTAARWRPLPDLTIVITDDLHAAVRRAEARDRTTFTAEQCAIHHQAAQLFEHLATIDPEHVRLLDRRDHDTKTLVATISQWITTAPTRPFGLLAPAALPR